jgi:hypothetical protein
MLVLKPTTHLVDIGKPDHILRLPTSARKKRGMKTRCQACGREVEDDTFAAVFKKGEKNMIFHEGCLDDEAKNMLKGDNPCPR